MNILFLASEVEGLVKTGGLADVARALPAELKKAGHDTSILMPCYRPLLQADHPTVLQSMEVPINLWDTRGTSVRQTEISGVTVYLLEYNVFYDRDGIYDDGRYAYSDNALRYALLCQAAFKLCKLLHWPPDIIHCNDWQTGLAPYYLKDHHKFDPFFSSTKTVLSVHNGAYQGHTPGNQAMGLGLNENFFTADYYEDHGDINLLKGGIALADAIVAVSPGYRNELLKAETSHGLWQTYNERKANFVGILNGCDYGQWDPETDPHIAQNFSLEDLSGKAACKLALQEQLGLAKNEQAPLFGVVSRLAEQKGFGYLIPALHRFFEQPYSTDCQLVILGSGDPDLAYRCRDLANRFPEQVKFIEGYNNPLAHQIEAGVDFFLMPSLFEPCGLNQIYSLKYGTLPIVRKVGGLRDTVKGLKASQSNWRRATGIDFDEATIDCCLDVMERARTLYVVNHDRFVEMQKNAMAQNFDWSKPTEQTIELYQSLLAVETEPAA